MFSESAWLFLTVRVSAVEDWEILPEIGLRNASSSHCRGFPTTGKFPTQGSVSHFWPPSEYPIIFSRQFRIPIFIKLEWGRSVLCGIKRKSRNAQTTLIWSAPYEWMGMHPTGRYDKFRVARSKPLMTSWTYWRFDCSFIRHHKIAEENFQEIKKRTMRNQTLLRLNGLEIPNKIRRIPKSKPRLFVTYLLFLMEIN